MSVGLESSTKRSLGCQLRIPGTVLLKTQEPMTQGANLFGAAEVNPCSDGTIYIQLGQGQPMCWLCT